jgi:putative tryptophan/tyrosine transport system substrate-binding protein
MKGDRMRRREFITLLGGAAAAWPLAARAQQGNRVVRLGALLGYDEHDSEGQARVAAFRRALAEFGWIEGRNIHSDFRFAGSVSPDSKKSLAVELVKLQPDVVLVAGPGDLTAVRRENPNIPIVFTSISDPVALGVVQSLARPGGNVTGFTQFAGPVTAKLVEALYELAPRIVRITYLFDPGSLGDNLRTFEMAARSLGLKSIAAPADNSVDIVRAIEAAAAEPNSGLLLASDTTILANRGLIVALAARHRLPAVYPQRPYVNAGGLMSYGTDLTDNFRRAADYVDRILKGGKPADLPVQQPTKFQFVLNLKAAKAMQLDVPTSILLRADEVIE